jgi:hypothetical protein
MGNHEGKRVLARRSVRRSIILKRIFKTWQIVYCIQTTNSVCVLAYDGQKYETELSIVKHSGAVMGVIMPCALTAVGDLVVVGVTSVLIFLR